MKKTLYNHLIHLHQCNQGSKRIIEFYSLSILVSLILNSEQLARWRKILRVYEQPPRIEQNSTIEQPEYDRSVN